ncbi:MAG: Uma2 family endonuclease [Blastocatellia bacterium]
MAAAIKDISPPDERQRDASNNLPLVRRFTLEEFEELVHLFPEDQPELINGEMAISPPPDAVHIEQTMTVENLLARQWKAIDESGCSVAGSSAWYAVPGEFSGLWVAEEIQGSHHVRPDVSVCYSDYLRANHRPPALLVIEVISVSRQSEIDRDLISKPEIYATLEIPAYWVIDRRDRSVWVHTAPEDGKYTRRTQHKGRRKLPAPGLDFLHITPAQIFTD